MFSVTDWLESMLYLMSPGGSTEVIFWIVAIIFAVAFFQLKKGHHSRFIEYAPTLMTALGILGTFIGVVIGLMHFNTHDIDQSIPTLLEGLKTAFVTSIVGMVAAILFNSLDAFFYTDKREAMQAESLADITPHHIHAALLEQTELLSRMVTGLSGSEEGSLVGQLKLLRAEQSDLARQQKDHSVQFDARLWSELEHFAEMMSKGATEQIIEALRQVIIDFNNNLTEQFGENFKALDASVKKLVEWQQAYKEQVEVMGAQYKQSVDSLMETRHAVAGIWDECKEIPLAMAELKTVLEVNQHQIAELQRHLEAFVLMRDQAVSAVPTIREKIDEVGNLLAVGATGLQTSLQETGQKLLVNSNEMKVALEEGTEHFRNSVTQTQQSFSEMAHSVSSSSEDLTSTMGDTVKEMKQSASDMLSMMNTATLELGNQLKSSSSELAQHLKNNSEQYNQLLQEQHRATQASFDKVSSGMVSGLQDSMSKSSHALEEQARHAIGTFGEAINKQLSAFEQATEREMNRELQSLGNSLISISKGFVKNYQQITDDYQRIMPQLQKYLNQTR